MESRKLSLDINTLLDVFQIEILPSHPVLETWLGAGFTLSDDHKKLLEICRQNFIKQGGEWNEEELKVKFLSFLFFIADLEVDKKLQTFYERPLVAKIKGESLSVICDCMVATPKGKGAPKSPYFFLQEFKKQKGDKHDPEGQMFAAMLISRELNKDIYPVYGAWLVGNQWCFTVLVDENYVCSRYYDASDAEDLLQIIFILRKLKDLILNR